MVTTTISHMLKKLKQKRSVLSRDMENIKKTQIEATERETIMLR